MHGPSHQKRHKKAGPPHKQPHRTRRVCEICVDNQSECSYIVTVMMAWCHTHGVHMTVTLSNQTTQCLGPAVQSYVTVTFLNESDLGTSECDSLIETWSDWDQKLVLFKGEYLIGSGPISGAALIGTQFDWAQPGPSLNNATFVDSFTESATFVDVRYYELIWYNVLMSINFN